MFKNLVIFNLKADSTALNLVDLQRGAFIPCTDLQAESSGWAPMTADYGFLYTSGRHQLLAFTVEKKLLPCSVVKRKVAEACAAQEKEQGFAPGSKARKAIKERVIDELLPRALAVRTSVPVWFDLAASRVMIDSVSPAIIDAIARALYRMDIDIEGIACAPTEHMTHWVDDNEPADFTLDDYVELQMPGERGTTVRYTQADLGDNKVLAHIKAGGAVTALALTWSSRVSFVLTHKLEVKKIKQLEVLTEKGPDAFEGAFVLATGEMSSLITALLGEVA